MWGKVYNIVKALTKGGITPTHVGKSEWKESVYFA